MPFIRLTQAGSKEFLYIRTDAILAVRPCGGASYGSNLDLSTAIGIATAEESPQQIMEELERILNEEKNVNRQERS